MNKSKIIVLVLGSVLALGVCSCKTTKLDPGVQKQLDDYKTMQDKRETDAQLIADDLETLYDPSLGLREKWMSKTSLMNGFTGLHPAMLKIDGDLISMATERDPSIVYTFKNAKLAAIFQKFKENDMLISVIQQLQWYWSNKYSKPLNVVLAVVRLDRTRQLILETDAPTVLAEGPK